MPLFEIVKADGTREKVSAEMAYQTITESGCALVIFDHGMTRCWESGTWLEVWRREGVGELAEIVRGIQ